ncbi:uncharacterized protein LOC143540127 [Bidens hawaiensis]|uniref:uncharacterized protein LOC143540127 n=1 Tax=Bidens hawaiensis TaxID=980011 RepID=UPI0040490086
MAKTNNNVVEAPATPGRPVFSFSVGAGSRKNFPSKWDDAQKWLISGPPAHVSKHQHHHKPIFTEDQPFNDPPDILLKDKLTNAEEAQDNQFSRFKCVVPINQGFVLKDVSTEMVVDEEVKEGSCPTPYKSVSPPRHTTPASMSGPLALLTNTSLELQECHLAKLQPGTGHCNWEEEEEDVSKSLRHFEINNNNNNNNDECPKTIPPCAWKQEQTARSHQRYQREEAKIEAWVNLQNAKAEAESKKLEVKIQKMRSKFEEKMMKRMTSVHRKAEEMRAAAQYEHNMQPPKSTKKSKDLNESLHFSTSCTCFPCSQTVKRKF